MTLKIREHKSSARESRYARIKVHINHIYFNCIARESSLVNIYNNSNNGKTIIVRDKKKTQRGSDRRQLNDPIIKSARVKCVNKIHVANEH